MAYYSHPAHGWVYVHDGNPIALGFEEVERAVAAYQAALLAGEPLIRLYDVSDSREVWVPVAEITRIVKR